MKFYENLNERRKDTVDLQNKIFETVDKLESTSTSSDRPGVLLGKIQSGKTRAFIGVMAHAFDKKFDVAIVLTKNSRLLGEQTTRRIRQELEEFCKSGYIDVYYVNEFNDTVLKKSQMLNKKVFVAIKNPSNIEKLIDCFQNNNPDLADKKVLIIDDEADYGSVGYRFNSDSEKAEMLTTAAKLNELRGIINDTHFLQVTATPYSLYLQPDELEIDGEIHKPIKPSFSVVINDHDKYIGGKFYFEENKDEESPASHLHITARNVDVATLSSKKQDLRILKNVASTDRLEIFRKSIINFLVGVAVRRVQFIKENGLDSNEARINLLPRFAFIFHIDTRKSKMNWQASLIEQYLRELSDLYENDSETFEDLIKESYFNDLFPSLEKGKKLKWIENIPSYGEVLYQILEIFEYEDFQTFLINSDNNVIHLANDDGQLRLETGLNFFVGGQVLDRGITIDNLIGFFYGRSPGKSQMDTVMQHARMYGARDKKDLCVTRFYTITPILERMQEIHDIDEALRVALQKGEDAEIICIQRAQNGRIIPTNPNRILISNVVTLKSKKTLFPYGFETEPKSRLLPQTEKIDQYLQSINGYTEEIRNSFKLNNSQFDEIIEEISTSFKNYDEGVPLNPDMWKAIVNRISMDHDTNQIHCYVQVSRRISRYKRNGDPSDNPYTTTTDIGHARQIISEENIPVLILLRQEGLEEDGWKDAPFYWPVLVLPNLERPMLFEWES